jgi:hypothetical protein
VPPVEPGKRGIGFRQDASPFVFDAQYSPRKSLSCTTVESDRQHAAFDFPVDGPPPVNQQHVVFEVRIVIAEGLTLMFFYPGHLDRISAAGAAQH